MYLLRQVEPGIKSMDELSPGQHDFTMDAVRGKESRA